MLRPCAHKKIILATFKKTEKESVFENIKHKLDNLTKRLICESMNKMAPGTKKEINFESALEELEKLLSDMESGELSLDQSISKFERAKECLDICRKKLDDAQLRINKVNGDLLEPFNPDDE